MRQVNRAFQVLIPLLVLNLLGPTNAVAGARMHPMLAELAFNAPDQRVAVIIQMADASDEVERLAEKLGGEITADLHLINGFAAEMPAGAVAELARFRSVRWISPDAPMETTSKRDEIDTSNLQNAYIRAIRADQVWNEARTYIQGQGVTVAVVDSGLYVYDKTLLSDFKTPTKPNQDYWDQTYRVVGYYLACNADPRPTECAGLYGHGQHILGIVGGDGSASNGSYIGVAPKVNLADVAVSDNYGAATASTVVQGLQWVYDHKEGLDIRVVNLSLNSSVLESYHTSPLAAAVEILWFNGVVVVVSAGNNGTADLYPPANDPFVITVGATDDRGTDTIQDDVIAPFSAYGNTQDGYPKPDLVAPGTNIISTMSDYAILARDLHPDNVVNSTYFRMSGTSTSAPMVAGAAALLLQDEPDLTPDQVKYRLMATANKDWPGYDRVKAGAGYLDVFAAVHGSTTESANTGLPASQLLWTGPDPLAWNSVNWNSVNWNSVNWNSVNWNSVNWNSVNWNSDYWDN